jgi:hypothetical protein
MGGLCVGDSYWALFVGGIMWATLCGRWNVGDVTWLFLSVRISENKRQLATMAGRSVYAPLKSTAVQARLAKGVDLTVRGLK